MSDFKKTPKRWLTADLHFSHGSIINYCKRPYKDVTEMNEAMVAEWNRVVAPEDTVYVLGDFSLNPKTAETYTPRLNGTKILISGNHDSTFPFTHGRRNKKQAVMKERYHKAGWSAIVDKTTVTLSSGHEVVLSHLPYLSAQQYDKRFLDMRPKDEGKILLHGHLHAKYLKNGRMIDVGWDQKHTLFSEDDIIRIINDKRSFIYSTLNPKQPLLKRIKAWLKEKFKREQDKDL